MKKLIAILLALVFVMVLASCGDDTDTTNSSNTTASSDVTTDSSTVNSTPANSENSDAPLTPPSEDTPLGPEDKPSDKPSVDDTAVTVEKLLGDALDVFDAEDVFGDEGKISTYTDFYNVDVSKEAVNKSFKIDKSGVYRLYGKSVNGQIYIKPQVKEQNINVILLLDGVNLTYTGSGPTIYAEDCAKVTIVASENSKNYLADSTINDENAVIRVRSCDLIMGGMGEVNIVGNTKHGISNTKNLTITGGKYTITSVGHAIYGKQSLTINGGKFDINSAKSGFKTGDDEIGNELEGKITINSCSAHIRCNTNGINSYGSVEINNGRIVIEALGKGIAATKNISINGGTFMFSTTEDAIKTDSTLSVLGKSNIKISTYGNGFEAMSAEVKTEGVIYIVTHPKYIEDSQGEYKLLDGEYILLDGTEAANAKKYKLIECKGFEVKGKLTINKATVGIDSFEDSMNATDVELNGGKYILSTTKDGIDASNSVNVVNLADVTVIASDKGIKAVASVTLDSGKTSIVATTDAIKADTVTIKSGTHHIFEKVEYVTSFLIRGGTVLVIGTTTNPTTAQAYIPNASGVISNKQLCTEGKYLTVSVNGVTHTVTLPKDYTEKICVLFASELEGSCKVIIGENEASEPLTQGAYQN